MYNYWVDWEEFNLIKNYIKSGDTVFDIGANMGFYTIWMSKFIGNGKIHAFEPDSENFERLKKNIKINNLIKNVVANKIALSNLNGIISFTKGLDGENHIADSSNQNTLQLQSQKIDSYLKDLSINPSITYMKIDVEGFEYAVLKGADAILLNNQIEIIQIEINKTISNSGKSITDLLDLLNEYQYSLCRYDVENNLLISTVYADSRENYFAVSDLEKINFKLKHQTN
jgi:FkbM family methyltransferase